MKRKVLFLIESLAGGGAEKVLTTLVQHIDETKFDVTVCAIKGGGVYEEEVKKSVKYKTILFEPKRRGTLSRLAYTIIYHLVYYWLPLSWVYKLFIPKRFDVEIAFIEGFSTKLLSRSTNKRAKKIAWVHVDLKQRPWPILTKVYKNIDEEKLAYSRYNSVVCVSHSVENVMIQDYGLQHTCTIYNPLDEERVRSYATQNITWNIDYSKYNIVSVGRLEKQKGYDLLLPIIQRLRNEGRNVHLWLIGEGTQRAALESQAINLGLSDNVTFTGFVSNPYSLMSKMSLFVCSSRAEGFSLVIAEALILGMPVVSMNCSGPNELLKNNKECLCDTYDELHDKISKAIMHQNCFKDLKRPDFLILPSVMGKIHDLLIR